MLPRLPLFVDSPLAADIVESSTTTTPTRFGVAAERQAAAGALLRSAEEARRVSTQAGAVH